MVGNNEDFDEVKQHVQAIMAQPDVDIPPQAVSLIEETLIKAEEENLSLKDALGFSQEMLEEIYQYGYHLCQSGSYKKALPVFQLLRQFDGTDTRFTFSVAACHHHMKQYVEAAGNYMLYGLLDPSNPLPYYHLCDCFTKMDQPLMALNALKLADRLAGKDPQYADLKGRIEIELEQRQKMEGSS